VFTFVTLKMFTFAKDKFIAMDFLSIFEQYKEPQLSGRYITLLDIEPLIKKFKSIGEVQILGHSVARKPIYLCKAGTGKTKILMWSQMHGNESTTTKALFDFFNVLENDSPIAESFLDHFTFYMLPMLNPDGSSLYTRENGNKMDLNRDFCDLSQPESKVLFDFFKDIKPDYCFNLHDQRTIYGVGYNDKPATISFLSPSYNEEREINEPRGKAIDVVAAMNDVLQQYIPGQVGRFDDSFNINCVGDTFQSHAIPTILFEAGHYPDDYQREITRKYIFVAMMTGLSYISENVIVGNRINDYLNIPQNNVSFFDFVYKNVKINYDGIEKITNFAAQFMEELIDGKISFSAHIAEVGISDHTFGHVTVDCKNQLYHDGQKNVPQPEQRADFSIGDMKFVNGKAV
jgi:hypothetical protein